MEALHVSIRLTTLHTTPTKWYALGWSKGVLDFGANGCIGGLEGQGILEEIQREIPVMKAKKANLT